ncbi:MAG: hypothetical protein NC093_11375 [Alistipes sp.]|nr:hypothetical protein [Alistipes sp.]
MMYKADAKIIYADIINLPHWKSPDKTPMTVYERAAQFSPFAALTGYEDMIEEEAREVGGMEELSESEMEILNAKINLIADSLENGQHPILQFTYFIHDMQKDGGSYVTMTERVRKIDFVERKIQLYRTTGVSKRYVEIDMDKIQDICGEVLSMIDSGIEGS